MGSTTITPKPWVPYLNTRDCSRGFCSLYCPQWCYIIFPPPPPFELNDDGSGPSFSPIVIAIIGILASAFLLVSYYAIISKYCKDRDAPSTRRENHFPAEESEENNQDHSNHAPWHNLENGLDEALIKSIKVFKYRKGDGLIEGTDCSVCLSEFQDGESLRLLPKCCHAFHLMCIDTWFKSHTNCPLCRANIALVNVLPPHHLPPLTESPPQNDPSLHRNPEIENVASEEELEMGLREGESQHSIEQISASTQAGDTGNSGVRGSTSDLINDEDGVIRRSVSMDCICPGRLSIADALRISQDDDDQIERSKFTTEVGESKWPFLGTSRPGNMTRILHCISDPVIKRSFSSGRFLFSKGERGRNLEIPL